jgi:hypothetical protein
LIDRACFCRSYFQRKALRLPFPKMYWFVLGSAKSLAINLLDIFVCLGLPCFSATHLRVKFSSSRSVHLHCHNGLAKVFKVLYLRLDLA